MEKIGENKKSTPKISRKKAIKKLGLTALSATTMMLLLNDPAKADSGTSPAAAPAFP
jgi:hypothetical protein